VASAQARKQKNRWKERDEEKKRERGKSATEKQTMGVA
jgi:hypothetical protein